MEVSEGRSFFILYISHLCSTASTWIVYTGTPRMAPGLGAHLSIFELCSLAMSGFEVCIRVMSILEQHWEPPWHQFCGLAILKGWCSSPLG